jgi:hypothetical protein
LTRKNESVRQLRVCRMKIMTRKGIRKHSAQNMGINTSCTITYTKLRFEWLRKLATGPGPDHRSLLMLCLLHCGFFVVATWACRRNETNPKRRTLRSHQHGIITHNGSRVLVAGSGSLAWEPIEFSLCSLRRNEVAGGYQRNVLAERAFDAKEDFHWLP